MRERTRSSVSDTINLSFWVSGRSLSRRNCLKNGNAALCFANSVSSASCCSTGIFSSRCGVCVCVFNLVISDFRDPLRVQVLPPLSLIRSATLPTSFSSQTAIISTSSSSPLPDVEGRIGRWLAPASGIAGEGQRPDVCLHSHAVFCELESGVRQLRGGLR